MRSKMAFGFQTGDLVKAVVPTGNYAGTHVGRVAVRSCGSFDIQTKDGKKTVNHNIAVYFSATMVTSTNLKSPHPIPPHG
jgi:hypothetical protein